MKIIVCGGNGAGKSTVGKWQVEFDEPEDAGILARFAREEPASYVSMVMRPGGLQILLNISSAERMCEYVRG